MQRLLDALAWEMKVMMATMMVVEITLAMLVVVLVVVVIITPGAGCLLRWSYGRPVVGLQLSSSTPLPASRPVWISN